MKSTLILLGATLAFAVSAQVQNQDYARRIILQCEAQYPTATIPQGDYGRMSQNDQLRQQCVQQLIAATEQKPTGPAPFKDGRVTGKVVNRLSTETPSKSPATSVPSN